MIQEINLKKFKIKRSPNMQTNKSVDEQNYSGQA